MSKLQVFVNRENVSQRQIKPLERIYQSFEHLEPIEGTVERPPHLIAHGEIRSGSQISEVKTAISVRLGFQKEDDHIEFSTNIGQLPKNPLGNAVLETLNHTFDGKFVTFNTEHEDNPPLVYTSTKPASWLNDRRFDFELENHAKTKALVNPILGHLSAHKQPDLKLTDSEATNIAREIIDNRLFDWRNRLLSKLPPSLPMPQHSREKNK